MKKTILVIILLLISISICSCAGAHYQALPGAPKMEKGQQRVAINASVSLGHEKKLKWYIPKNWLISNWGYSFEYRYGLGNNTDVGIYPAGLNILPCAVDLRWVDKERDNQTNYHRIEFIYNPITFNSQIANSGIRYDYFVKKDEIENIMRVQGASLLVLKFWNADNGTNGNNGWFHIIPGAFIGAESENVLYELDFLPGFNYFMEKPEAKNPFIYFEKEKQNIPEFLLNDVFIGLTHGNSYTE